MPPEVMEHTSANINITQIPSSAIFSDPEFNCRGQISVIDVTDLARDIAANGLQQPIVVQPFKNPLNPEHRYRIISGHRRHAAMAVLLRWKDLPCIVNVEKFDEQKALILNFTENLHRKQLNLLQESQVCERLSRQGLNEPRIAEVLGMSRGWVQVRRMLMKCPVEVQQGVAAGIFSQDDVRKIYEYPDHKRNEVAKAIKETKSRANNRDVEKKVNIFNPTQKKRRSNPEICQMQDLVARVFGNGLATRLLGWAIGHVTDGDIHLEIEKVAKKLGKEYTSPKSDV